MPNDNNYVFDYISETLAGISVLCIYSLFKFLKGLRCSIRENKLNLSFHGSKLSSNNSQPDVENQYIYNYREEPIEEVSLPNLPQKPCESIVMDKQESLLKKENRS